MAKRAKVTLLHLHDLKCMIAKDSALAGLEASPENIARITNQSISWATSARADLLAQGFIVNGVPYCTFASFDDRSYDNRVCQLSSFESIAAIRSINRRKELDLTLFLNILINMTGAVAQVNKLEVAKCATLALKNLFDLVELPILQRKHSTIANEAMLYAWAMRLPDTDLMRLFEAVHSLMKALGSKNPNIAEVAIMVRSITISTSDQLQAIKAA